MTRASREAADARRLERDANELRMLLLQQFDYAYAIVVVPELNRARVQRLLTEVRFLSAASPERIEALADAVKHGRYEWAWCPVHLRDIGGVAAHVADGHHRTNAALWFDVSFRNTVLVRERAESHPVRRVLHDRLRAGLVLRAIKAAAVGRQLATVALHTELDITGDVRAALAAILSEKPERFRGSD